MSYTYSYVPAGADIKEPTAGLVDYNDLKFVLHSRDRRDEDFELYTPEVIKRISTYVTQQLTGVHPEGKKIVIADDVILQTISYFVSVSDFLDKDRIIFSVSAYLIEIMKDDFATEKLANSYSAWVQLYPTESGIQQVPSSLRTRNKRLTGIVYNY